MVYSSGMAMGRWFKADAIADVDPPGYRWSPEFESPGVRLTEPSFTRKARDRRTVCAGLGGSAG